MLYIKSRLRLCAVACVYTELGRYHPSSHADPYVIIEAKGRPVSRRPYIRVEAYNVGTLLTYVRKERTDILPGLIRTGRIDSYDDNNIFG